MVQAGTMVAFMCRWYGWQVEYVLAMPVRRFYLLFREGYNMRCQDLVDQCDIQAIAIADSDYQKELRKAFQGASIKERPSREKMIEKAEIAPTAEEAELTRAKIFSFFQMKKELHGGR